LWLIGSHGWEHVPEYSWFELIPRLEELTLRQCPLNQQEFQRLTEKIKGRQTRVS